jgi:hypothetical protein
LRSSLLNLNETKRESKRRGCPKEAVSDETIKKVNKIILNDRKGKLIEVAEEKFLCIRLITSKVIRALEIAETLKISKERV